MVYLFTLIRGVIMMLYLGVTTAIFSILSVILCLLFGARDFAFEMDRWLWGKVVFFLTGIQVEVRGKENLPKDGQGYLYLFNHTSYTDIIAMIIGLPYIPKFGAKIELFSIPFFGQALRAIGNLPIARNNRAEVLRVYKEAEVRAQAGECFALAPEGTRQVGGQLGKFKKGPFLFAMGAKIPVVPLIIAGAEQVQPKGAFLMNVGRFRRKIVLQIQPYIDSTQFTEETIGEFQHKTRQSMNDDYIQLQKELGVSPSSQS